VARERQGRGRQTRRKRAAAAERRRRKKKGTKGTGKGMMAI